jgi:hypothetical protein
MPIIFQEYWDTYNNASYKISLNNRFLKQYSMDKQKELA